MHLKRFSCTKLPSLDFKCIVRQEFYWKLHDLFPTTLMSGALTVFELAGLQEGGKLVGENLAGGTDPGGTVGGPGKNNGSRSLADRDVGKSGHVSDSCCGVRDPSLDSSSAPFVSGHDLEKEKDHVESNKVKSPDGLQVGSSEHRT